MVTITLLGPVSLEVHGRPIPIRSVRTRSFLAVLGLALGKQVTIRHLVDQLWGSRPPSTAVQQIHNMVSQLRSGVWKTATAAGLGEPDWLRTNPDGYQFGPDADVDLTRFLDDINHAERAQASGRARRAKEFLDQGLARWTRDVLSGTTPQVLSEAPRLEAQRRIARLRRIQLAFPIGDAVKLRSEAEDLLADDPFDEQVRMHVMRILHLEGRRKEALAIYREGARMLRTELGIEPGAQLQEAHQRILNDTFTDPAGTGPKAPPVPAQLPPAPGSFIGRDAELARLLQVITSPHNPARPPVAVVSGIGGVGKTSLAVMVGHIAAAEFPDGQVFVHLRGPSGPLDSKQALARVLRALGVRERLPRTIDERRALLRTLTANKAILIVADAADSAEQVIDLVPAEPRCAVVVTAHHRLTAMLWSESIQLAPLAGEPSRRLLQALAGDTLPASDDPDTHTIILACAGLPLALVIAGARLRSLGAGRRHDFAQVLHEESSRLDSLSLGAVDVSETLSRGIALLSPDARRTLVAVSGLASPSLPGWVALAVCDGDRARALAAADEMMTAHVAHAASERDQPDTRFGVHDLLRLQLREQLLSDSDGAHRALDTILLWWITLSRAVSAAMSGTPFETSLLPSPEATAPAEIIAAATADPAGWTRQEQHNLVAAAQAAAVLGRHELAVALVDACRRPLAVAWLQDTWEQLTAVGLQAARHSSRPEVRGRALLARGSVFAHTGDYPLAARCFWLAKEMLYGVDNVGAATAASNLSGALLILGEKQAAIRNCDDVIDIPELPPSARAMTLRRRADALSSAGQLSAGLDDFVEARKLLPDEKNWETRAHLLDSEARLYLKLERPSEARSRLVEAIASARAHKSLRVEGYLLLTEAEVEQSYGDFDAALTSARRATRLLEELSDRDGHALAVYRIAMITVANDSVSAAAPWLAQAQELLRGTGRPVELQTVEQLLDRS